MFIPFWIIVVLLLFIPGALDALLAATLFVIGGAACLATLAAALWLIVYGMSHA